MPDLHLPSFIAGAIVGPFLWAFDGVLYRLAGNGQLVEEVVEVLSR